MYSRIYKKPYIVFLITTYILLFIICGIVIGFQTSKSALRTESLAEEISDTNTTSPLDAPNEVLIEGKISYDTPGRDKFLQLETCDPNPGEGYRCKVLKPIYLSDNSNIISYSLQKGDIPFDNSSEKIVTLTPNIYFTNLDRLEFGAPIIVELPDCPNPGPFPGSCRVKRDSGKNTVNFNIIRGNTTSVRISINMNNPDKVNYKYLDKSYLTLSVRKDDDEFSPVTVNEPLYRLDPWKKEDDGIGYAKFKYLLADRTYMTVTSIEYQRKSDGKICIHRSVPNTYTVQKDTSLLVPSQQQYIAESYSPEEECK